MAAPIHTRILCIGNRFVVPDSAGPLVHDLLAGGPLPAGVELVDAGLGGLRLLPLLEQTGLVIFVDAVSGFRDTQGVVVADPLESPLPAGPYDHDAGLGYLLEAAPHVLEGGLPEMVLVGIEGAPTPECCREAAATCLAFIEARQRGNRIPAPAGIDGGCNG